MREEQELRAGKSGGPVWVCSREKKGAGSNKPGKWGDRGPNGRREKAQTNVFSHSSLKG